MERITDELEAERHRQDAEEMLLALARRAATAGDRRAAAILANVAALLKAALPQG